MINILIFTYNILNIEENFKKVCDRERNSKCGAPEKGIWSNRKRCMVLKHSEQQGEWRNMWSEKNHVKSLESGKEFMFILTVRIQ